MLKEVSLFNRINVHSFDFAGTTLFVLKICEGVQLYFLGLWYGEAGGSRPLWAQAGGVSTSRGSSSIPDQITPPSRENFHKRLGPSSASDWSVYILFPFGQKRTTSGPVLNAQLVDFEQLCTVLVP